MYVLRCLACNSADPLDVSEGAAKCRACSTVFPCEHGVPILFRDWQEHATQIGNLRELLPAWYDEVQAVEAESPWRHHLAKRREYVESILTSQGKVDRLLDLGCGDGTNLQWLEKHTKQLYASDYNLLRLIRAKTFSYGVTLFAADILDYPAFDCSFDVVYFNHVLEHIPEDQRALSTVYRILKPGGILVLGVPNEGSWWWQLAYRRSPESLANTDHVHFYTAESVGAKLADAGLLVREVKRLGWGPPDWELDMKLRKYKFLDDCFDRLGRILLPGQASSLYLIAVKPEL